MVNHPSDPPLSRGCEGLYEVVFIVVGFLPVSAGSGESNINGPGYIFLRCIAVCTPIDADPRHVCLMH